MKTIFALAAFSGCSESLCVRLVSLRSNTFARLHFRFAFFGRHAPCLNIFATGEPHEFARCLLKLGGSGWSRLNLPFGNRRRTHHPAKVFRSSADYLLSGSA